MRTKKLRMNHGEPGHRAVLAAALGLAAVFWVFDSVLSAYVFHSGTILEQLVSPTIEKIWLRMAAMVLLAGFGYFAPRVISRSRTIPGGSPNTDALSQSIFDNIQDGLVVLDTDLNIIHVNPYIAEVYSDSRPLVGKKCYEVFQHRQTACLHCPCIEALRDGELHAEGTERTAFPLRDSQGNFLGVALHLKHVSKNGDTSETIRQERDILAQINETSPVGIVKVNAEGRIVLANARAEKILGLSREDACGRLYHDPKWQITDFEGHEFPEEKLPFRRVMDTGNSVFDVRHAISWPDGSRVYLSINAAPLFNEAHEPDGMVASIEDITDRKQAYDALWESERRLATLMSNLPGMAYRCSNDENWKIEFVSMGVRELFGYDPDDLQGKKIASYTEMIHPDDRENVRSLVRDRVTNHEPFEITYRVRTAAGDEKWVSEMGRGIFSADGTLLALEGFIFDITQSKEADRRIRASEKKYRELYEGSRDGFAMVDMEGTIIEANHTFQEMLGYSMDELTSLTYRDITPAKWHDVERRILEEQVMRRGYSELYEKEYIRKDGTIFPIEIRTYLRRTSTGRPLAMWAFVSDLTERKRAEEALSQSEIQYRTTVDALSDGLHVINRDLRIVLVNEELKELNQRLHLDENLVGKTVFDAYPFLPDTVRDEYQHVFETGQPLITEETNLIDGQRVVTETRKIPIFDGAQVIQVITIIRDITERKKAEEALRHSEERYSNFVSQSSEGIWRIDLDEPCPIDLPIADQIAHVQRHSYFAECNDVAARMYGFDSTEELIGKRCADFFPQQGEGGFASEFIRSGYRASEAESEELDIQGNLKHFLNNNIGIIENGMLLSIWGIQRDVTERRQSEDALRESEERYRTIVETAGEGIWIIDMEGCTTFVNRQMAEMLGYTIEEMLGSLVSDYLDDENLALWKKQLNHRKQGANGKYDLRFRRKDGHALYTIVHARPLFDVDGNVKGAAAMVADITDRKRAENALRESEAAKRTLIDAIPDMMFVVDRNGTYLDFYPSSVDQPYVSPDTFLGKTGREVLPPEVADDHLRCISRALETGEPQISEYALDLPDGRKYYETRIVASDENTVLALARNVTDRKLADEALRKEREFNETLIESSPTFFVAIEPNGKTLMMNRAMLSALGYTRGEVVGTDYLTTFVPENDRQELAKVFSQLTKTRTATRNENRIITKDGRVMLVEWHGQPVLKPDGNLDFFFGVGVDITERKRAEEERDRLFNLSIDMFSIIGFDGHFIQVNPAWKRILGWTAEELLGKTWTGLIHPDDYKKSVDEGGRLVTGQAVFSLENRCRCKDGSYRWLSWNAFPLADEGLIFAVTRDITERKRAEEERDRLFNHSIDMLAVTGLDGLFKQVNPAWRKTLGWTDTELLSSQWLDFVHPEDGQITRDANARLASGQAVTSFENRYRCKDGTYRWLSWNSLPLPDENLIFAVARDVTERKQAEEALIFTQFSVDRAADAVFWMEPDGRLTYVNDAACESLGYAREELMALNLAEIDPDFETSKVKGTLEILRNRGSVVFETRHRAKDGRLFPVEINSNHMRFEGREYICAFARDITTRQLAENELRESEKRYRTLVDTSPIPIMVYVDERFVFMNSAAVTALGGTTVGDFIGRSIWDVLQPDSVESGRSPGWWILEPKGSAGLIKENWVRLDGKSIDVELFAIEIDYRGKSAFQVVFNDISERTTAEQKLLEYQHQLRALASEVTMAEERERRQIASNLHDGISQNLALAKMQLVNLHDTKPSEQTSAPIMHTVELLEQALEHMRSLTFELSPPVLHRLGLEPAIVGLAEQMQEKYGLQIDLEIADAAFSLSSDVRVMLFRAVRELLINVIKHAQTQRAKISMAKKDQRIIIEVLDYGEGCDPAQAEPDYQGKTGFGLFSIRERLEYLGGSLNIDSPPGGGTRVVLTAPLAGEMAGKEQ